MPPEPLYKEAALLALLRDPSYFPKVTGGWSYMPTGSEYVWYLPYGSIFLH